jgi:hypothetical protein
LEASQVVPLQQPDMQVVAQPAQAPPGHCSPAKISQVVQAPPPVPHADGLAIMQTSFWQQPVGQLVALQWHAPPTQASPAPHSALDPQLQTPAVQLSAPRVEQAAQLPPAVPQVCSEGISHSPSALQQPLGQVFASQVHTWLTHFWPTEQAGLLPQAQRPSLPQPSARSESQLTQPPPPAPQDVSEGLKQEPWLQQPFWQETASHWHSPPTHSWPAAQAGWVPHWQTPLTHESAERVSQGLH